MENKKICKQCGKMLDLSNFYKNNKSVDGYKHTCKQCYKQNNLKTYICKNCNREFESYEKRKFCSHKCSCEFRDTRTIMVCQTCGKHFKQKQNKQIFCCNECRLHRKDNNKYETIKCAFCEKEFQRLKCYNKGKKHLYCSKECQIKGWSKFYSGENSPEYDFNKSLDERLKNRKYIEYYEWRKKVYERDNFTCQCCGDNEGGNLVAHHIFNYSEHNDLKTDVNNGITLCKKCHKIFHDTYGYRNNNQQQIYEFINDMPIRSEAKLETLGTFND